MTTAPGRAGRGERRDKAGTTIRGKATQGNARAGGTRLRHTTHTHTQKGGRYSSRPSNGST